MDDILDLHRESRATLGFLPQGAFQERADAGLLLAAVEQGHTVGYALYDLPRQEIALRHLCVGSKHRGQGLAGALVQAIQDRHGDRRGIKVRCRRDWPAHHMWPHLGFVPIDETPGRSLQGHLLTTWWRDFGQPTLFTFLRDAEEPRVVAALDTNVALDLLLNRPDSAGSEGLLADWVADLARLVVTSHVAVEVDRHTDPGFRRRARAHLLQFPWGDPDPQVWKPLWQRLRQALGDHVRGGHDDDDLRLLAQAHAVGAQFFVSRDQRTLSRFASAAAETIGIEVLSPAAFLNLLWNTGDARYEPRSLEDTSFSIDAVRHGEIDALIARFLDHSQGERRGVIRDQLHELLADPERSVVRVVREADGTCVALVGHRIVGGVVELPLVRGTGPKGSTVVRQMLYLRRRAAPDQGARILTVTDPSITRPVARALEEEGFVRSAAGWTGATIPLAATPSSVADVLQRLDLDPALDVDRVIRVLLDGPSAAMIDDIEQRFWPLRILDDTLPTFLVPIHPGYASQLFDTDLSLGTLFPRPDHLGISREHVYYRAPRPDVLTTPARVLWYITGQSQAPGAMCVRACSRLVEVTVDRPRVLHRRFAHLGVYDLPEVEAAAQGGRAMALRFTHTEPLEPVPLARLREVCRRRGASPLLQSPWRLPEHVFQELYGGGSHGQR